MVQEQFVYGVVGIGEDVFVGFYVDDVLVQVYCVVWFVGYWFGYEGCGDVVFECGFVYGVFEYQDLVGQVEGVVMMEVDFYLCGVFFVDQCIQVKVLGFVLVVYVFEQWVEFVGGVDGE